MATYDSLTWAEAMASISNNDKTRGFPDDSADMERPTKRSFCACQRCRTLWIEGRRQAMHAKCVQCLVVKMRCTAFH